MQFLKAQCWEPVVLPGSGAEIMTQKRNPWQNFLARALASWNKIQLQRCTQDSWGGGRNCLSSLSLLPPISLQCQPLFRPAGSSWHGAWDMQPVQWLCLCYGFEQTNVEGWLCWLIGPRPTMRSCHHHHPPGRRLRFSVHISRAESGRR